MSTSYKIHHLNKKQTTRKKKRTNYCSNFLDRFPSVGHWRFISKRWGLHKYKLVIGICIAELLCLAGAAMPQEDQQLGHLGLRLPGEKQGMTPLRKVSFSRWVAPWDVSFSYGFLKKESWNLRAGSQPEIVLSIPLPPGQTVLHTTNEDK